MKWILLSLLGFLLGYLVAILRNKNTIRRTNNYHAQIKDVWEQSQKLRR